jgi:hypothetical protein
MIQAEYNGTFFTTDIDVEVRDINYDLLIDNGWVSLLRTMQRKTDNSEQTDECVARRSHSTSPAMPNESHHLSFAFEYPVRLKISTEM